MPYEPVGHQRVGGGYYYSQCGTKIMRAEGGVKHTHTLRYFCMTDPAADGPKRRT